MIKGKQKTKQGNLKHNIFISHFIRAIFWNDQDWKSLKKNAQICLSVFTINYINKRTPFTRVVWPSRSLHEGLYGSSDGCCYVDRCHLTRVVRPSRVYMKDYMDLVMAVVMLTDTICLPTNHQPQLLIVFHVHSCRPSRTGNTHQCKKNIFMSKGCQ